MTMLVDTPLSAVQDRWTPPSFYIHVYARMRLLKSYEHTRFSVYEALTNNVDSAIRYQEQLGDRSGPPYLQLAPLGEPGEVRRGARGRGGRRQERKRPPPGHSACMATAEAWGRVAPLALGETSERRPKPGLVD